MEGFERFLETAKGGYGDVICLFTSGNKGVLAEFTSLGYVGHMREML